MKIPSKWSRWARDAGERILWTSVQVAAGVAIVEVSALPEWAAVPIAAGLAWIKAQAAKRLGDPDTAALTR